jgi:uncharacterized protein
MKYGFNRRYWRNLFVFALSIFLAGGIFVVLFFSYQGAYSYTHPNRVRRQTGDNPSRFGIPFQTLELTTKDDIKLAAWYTPTQNGALVLVLHGYAGSRSAQMHSLFARHGFGVLSWDARAHGESQGEVCTFGYRESRFDVQAALEFVDSLADIEHIAAFGESMGAATLIQATADHPQIEALIADSAFAAIEDMLARVVPSPLLQPGIKFFVENETQLEMDDLRPVDVITRISPRPIFIIQGDSDQTVPPDSALRLFQASGEPKRLWVEEGVGHVGTFAAMPQEYEQRLVGFLDQYLLGKYIYFELSTH